MEDKKYRQLFHAVQLKYYKQDGSGGCELKKGIVKKRNIIACLLSAGVRKRREHRRTNDVTGLIHFRLL